MNDNWMRQVLPLLPREVSGAVQDMPGSILGKVEELRFRMDCEITAVISGQEQPLSLKGPLVCTDATLEHLINAATGYSAYAAENFLRHGFLPLPGGHRLGFCGTAVVTDGRVETLRDLSSANLRIARQQRGCARFAMESLGADFGSTLILGPPGSGKTTLLRDMIRMLSDVNGQRVGVVDSRGEIAACSGGRPQMQVGRRTDVVSMTSKEYGMELLLRAMNPQWIAVDEITAASDVEAMMRASYCGVRLLATAHAFCREDLMRRPLYREMMQMEIFQNLLVLDASKQMKLERMDAIC